MHMMLLADLNAADRVGFIAALGGIFEDSPWVAQAAWPLRPFATREQLCETMCRIVRETPLEQQTALIAAHPDLGAKSREHLSAASRAEQHAAGLEHPAPQLLRELHAANRAYRERFGFPFVICAREHTLESILAEMRRRFERDRVSEIASAIDEICKIAALRLRDLVDEP